MQIGLGGLDARLGPHRDDGSASAEEREPTQLSALPRPAKDVWRVETATALIDEGTGECNPFIEAREWQT
jgi:hypothetical protein